MAACTTPGLSSLLAHCKESPSSVLTAQKTQPGCWADMEIPREGVCRTLELFCCYPDVGKGGPAAGEKGKVAKVLAEEAGGPAHSPETWASLPAESWEPNQQSER